MSREEQLRLAEVEDSLFQGALDQQISVAYLGSVLEAAQMDAVNFADSLRGFAKLVSRSGYLLFGDEQEFSLQVQGGFERGSFIAHLHIFTELLAAVDSKSIERIATIMSVCGFTLKDAGKSLWTLLKKKLGRPITDDDDLDSLLPDDGPLTKADLIRIFNDAEIRAAMLAALKPLRSDGYEQIQTRQDQKPVEVITMADLAAADAAEEDAVTIEETRDLAIEKVAFRDDLAWHFSDEGKTFDAQITDPKLWARVAEGERFAAGDRLTAVLRTVAHVKPRGS